MGKYKINELLEEGNKSLSALANFIGVELTALKYNLEHDKVSFEQLEVIAHALEVNVSDLFNENFEETEINGKVKNGNKTYDFVAFLNELVQECNMEHDCIIKKNKQLKNPLIIRR